MYRIRIGNTQWYRSTYRANVVKVLTSGKDDAKTFDSREEAEGCLRVIVKYLPSGIAHHARIEG